MNATTEATHPKLPLSLSRTIRAVGVNVTRGVRLVHKPIKFLTVMHARVSHLVLSDQFVPGICVHVVLVTEKAFAVLLGPARIFVFLPVFSWILLPRLRRLAGLHGLILFTAVTLLGHRHNGGIDHLATARDVALRL